MSELWQPGALELADRLTDLDDGGRLRIAVMADQIEPSVGSVTPIDPVLA